jgi:two-component system, LuxR family, response regulator FixJ
MGSLAVHVVDDDSRRRASVSRAVLAMGHHAEVYADSDELIAHLPREGVVVALDEAICGGFSNLAAVFQREGRWLGIVATSLTPTIEHAVEAIRQGAADYVPWPVDALRLAAAIARAADDAEKVRERQLADFAARAKLDLLTSREREVLGFVAEGLTSRAIGERLEISARTVEIHRINLIAKLGARNTADAVRFQLGGT